MPENHADVAHITLPIISTNPIAYDLRSAAAAVGYSTDTIKEIIRQGGLNPRYANSKPVILHEELVEWARQLPLDPPRRLR